MDIRVSYNGDSGGFDIGAGAGDLITDAGLETAVILSLFLDRRVDADELDPGETARGGWWGDLFPDVAGDQIGSRLWLLRRAKRTVETQNRAEEYSKEALQWMLDDGVAETLTVSASFDTNGFLLLSVSISQPAGSVAYRFRTEWAAEAA